MTQAGRRRARGEDPTPRANLYDEVTARIVAELEAGRFPWVQPWGRASGGGAIPGLPRNALTARNYSGVNVLILWGAVIEHGYPSQSWLTFRQAREAGGAVRKGEKGVTVVYADRFTPEAEKQRARASGEDARTIPFLKRFTVFNVAQCEGLRAGPLSLPGFLKQGDEFSIWRGSRRRVSRPEMHHRPSLGRYGADRDIKHISTIAAGPIRWPATKRCSAIPLQKAPQLH